jgi:protein-tyrosine-phosphatase
MGERVYRVLFLPRRNSARSILAEVIMNNKGRGAFLAYSAGVTPSVRIDPRVIEMLEAVQLPTTGLRPKHVDEFTGLDAPDLDFVFTLSDTAANESPPEWPGRPVTAHWRSPDPILADGAEWEKKQAFSRVYSELERRLNIFMNLPFLSLDRISLKKRLDDIGRAPRRLGSG